MKDEETEDEFHIRIEKDVVRACVENPGTDPEALRQQMIFMERLHKLDPTTMAQHILDVSIVNSKVLHDPETPREVLCNVGGMLLLSVTALSKRLMLLAEETQDRILLPGNGTQH